MVETTNQSNISHQDFGSSMETGPWQAMARLGSRRQVQDWSPTGSHVRCTQSSSPRFLWIFWISASWTGVIYIYTHIYPYIPLYTHIYPYIIPLIIYVLKLWRILNISMQSLFRPKWQVANHTGTSLAMRHGVRNCANPKSRRDEAAATCGILWPVSLQSQLISKDLTLALASHPAVLQPRKKGLYLGEWELISAEMSYLTSAHLGTLPPLSNSESGYCKNL